MRHFHSDIGNRVHHRHVVAFASLLTPIIAVIAPLGLAPLLGVSAVALLGLRRMRTGIWLSRPNQVTVVLGLLFAWILVSYFWSIDTGAFTDKIPRILSVLIAGIVFFDGSRDLDFDAKQLARRMLIIGVSVGLALVFVDRISDAQVRRLMSGEFLDQHQALVSFNRTVTAFALLIWPAALVIWRRKPLLAVAAWMASFAIILSFESNAAVAGLLFGGAIFALALWKPKGVSAAIGLVVAVLIMVGPLIPTWLPDRTVLKQHQETITNSGYHRMLIWKFVAQKIAERPVLGWGFNTSRSIPGNKRDLDFAAAALPLHPHNASLQVWLELGLPGAALAAILFARIMFGVSLMATAAIDKASSVGLIVVVLTIGHLSYGAWQSWWLAAIWLIACFMSIAIQPTGERSDRIR